jgi:peptide subunit release factor RF-3
VRWVGGSTPAGSSVAGHYTVAADRHDRAVLLFQSEWERNYFQREHRDVELLSESPA